MYNNVSFGKKWKKNQSTLRDGVFIYVFFPMTTILFCKFPIISQKRFFNSFISLEVCYHGNIRIFKTMLNLYIDFSRNQRDLVNWVGLDSMCDVTVNDEK